MKGFAAIARPLTDLLIGHPTNTKSKQKRGNDNRTPFIWGPAQQNSFDVLVYAEYTKPFTFHMDASSSDIETVLF